MTATRPSSDGPAIGIGLVRPDLLGTYGDGGNAIVLAQRLRWRGIAADVVPLLHGAEIPDSIRVLVLGGGEDAAQMALFHDRVLLANVARAVEGGASVLAVCAGMQVIGHRFSDGEGTTQTGLGLLDCVTDRLPVRAVGECLVEAGPAVADLPSAAGSDGARVLLTGFENHGGHTVLGPGSVPLGRVLAGVGNGDGIDGAVTGHVVGTYLHGPVLARNAVLADRLLTWAVGELDPLPRPLVDRLHSERVAAARAAGADVGATDSVIRRALARLSPTHHAHERRV